MSSRSRTRPPDRGAGDSSSSTSNVRVKVNSRVTEFHRRAVDRCWDRIRKATKAADPDCIIWLSSHKLSHPQMVDSRMLREVDWLMNEAGDMESVAAVRDMVGEDTRLITCLANWNNQDPLDIVPEALEAGVGLYGFCSPGPNSLLPPVSTYLDSPLDSLRGDDKNIAVLARVYNQLPIDFTQHEAY